MRILALAALLIATVSLAAEPPPKAQVPELYALTAGHRAEVDKTPGGPLSILCVINGESFRLGGIFHQDHFELRVDQGEGHRTYLSDLSGTVTGIGDSAFIILFGKANYSERVERMIKYVAEHADDDQRKFVTAVDDFFLPCVQRNLKSKNLTL